MAALGRIMGGGKCGNGRSKRKLCSGQAEEGDSLAWGDGCGIGEKWQVYDVLGGRVHEVCE